MDIRQVDLNLLVAFHAMSEHRSVTRAAEAVGLSQPAMSAAVSRLRLLFNDALFVKTGAGMQPTPRAAELDGAVRRVIETIKADILPAPGFEPLQASKVFTLVTPDIAEVHFLPRILAAFAREAPHCDLRTLSMPRQTAAEALETGAAELAIGYLPDLQKAGFFLQKLFRNDYVCIVRGDHPAIGERLTLKTYLAASHAVVSPDGREHLLDQFLQRRGLKRRVLVGLSHFMSLLPIIEASDLVATVPRDLANICMRYASIRIVDPPFKAPVVEVHQFWHRRFHQDASNIWLRGLVQRLFVT
ncbi:LysR family transcriptional regulator [Variovorax sp. J2P1-59]|uniref:LysR family transcriptional regulator n=1 Tax=Variovorax flavidus TaxID=3053501 RepID=UPI0025780A9C|nr:LysR family transcriptional regulator [Variovorax sp. J2P1-59]MDM0073227.1 LysR family transcriptional regulator [Variovorax sp. J2P1-59]